MTKCYHAITTKLPPIVPRFKRLISVIYDVCGTSGTIEAKKVFSRVFIHFTPYLKYSLRNGSILLVPLVPPSAISLERVRKSGGTIGGNTVVQPWYNPESVVQWWYNCGTTPKNNPLTPSL